MNILTVLLMPAILAGVLIYGLVKRVNVFETFTDGAGEGVRIAVSILPTYIGMITAVKMMEASGALDGLISLLVPLSSLIGIPAEVMPIAIVRPISGSGALALVEQLFGTHHPDSFVGRLASVVEGANETTLYVFSLYFASVGVKKTRHTLLCAGFADCLTLLLATTAVRLFFG